MKAFSKRVKTNKRWQQYSLGSLVGVTLLGVWILPVLADGTPAGLTIDNTAQGTFESPNNPGVPIQVDSNTVRLTIAEVAGIDVAAISGVEAPGGVTNAGPAQGDNVVSSEDVVYYTFRITNVGNDQTQFFIPDSPASVTNGVFDAVATGPISVIAYHDGTTTTAVNIPIPNGGLATGDGVLGAGLPDSGSVPVNGYVEVRIPIKANAGLTAGADINVVFGNTPDAGTQNTPVSATNEFPGANDVTTQDNPDGAGIAPGDLVGGPNTEREASDRLDVTVGVPNLDYGDAPDPAAGTDAGDYETAPGRGPSHVVDNTTFLGTAVDAETSAEGDGAGEDDGVELDDGTPATFHGEILAPGQTFDLDITTAGPGVLNAWIDFNGNGDFNDPGEQIATDVVPVSNSIELDDIMVPFAATPGTTYARFRYSTDTGLSPDDAATDGEVEDYEIIISAPVPNLRLVKRVTRLGATATAAETTFTTVVDEASDPDDNATLDWPAGYLEGAVTATPEPSQEVDYTIYFLSDGNTAASDVRICDLIPDNTTYVSGSLMFSQGGAVPTPLTDAVDTDAGNSFDSAAGLVASCVGTNTDGGVIVSVPGSIPHSTGKGAPANSHGFIRFTVTID